MLSDLWKLEQTGAGERAAHGHGRQEPPRAPACALRGQFSDVSLSVPDLATGVTSPAVEVSVDVTC